MQAEARRKAGAQKPAPKEKEKFFQFAGKVDIPMLLITLALLVFGITMMFSAGHALSMRDYNDSYAYAKKQMIAAAIGLVAMFFICYFDCRWLKREFHIGKFKFTVAHLALWGTLAFTALVIPFGVSNIENGPRRWIQVPVFGTVQPSDFLKVGLIIFMAYYISVNYDRMRLFYYGMFKPLVLFAVVAALMMAQPHLSGLLIMTAICGGMLFIGGMNWKPLILFVGLGVGLLLLMLAFSEFSYFQDRIIYTFDPEADIGNKTYQSYQAALAIGSGGFWGVGFGNSMQKYGALPEAHNDFVFAVLCEELGFVGGFTVLLLFMVFVFRGFQIARAAADKFDMMLATGITLHVGIQALLNIGVNCCCIPNTGISLPFFSYGGTALVMQLAEVGLLLSVSKRAHLK
ncbi:MAG: cell division protein FtsW [Oscillospiraceae bacterium]|nr:cell division protein FtsW [Oscillospiraceae bacterium]